MAICTFFGHRFLVFGTGLIREALENTIRNLIVNHQVDTFWCGGKGDFDSFVLETLRKLKQESFPHIQIALVLAYVPTNKEIYQSYLRAYDSVFCPEGIEGLPRFGIVRRNKWMAKNADYVVCYVRTEQGGAYDSMKYAEKKGKPVFNLGISH